MKRWISALLLAAFLLAGCTAAPPPLPEVPATPAAPEKAAPEAPPLPESESAPGPEPLPKTDLPPETFVRVTDELPQVRVALRYATEDNFTGQVIYTFRDAWLRHGTVQKLSIAQETLAAQGYGLLIWDAFRPTAAQFRLWEVCPDPAYVANPERGFSSHSRGNTVDLTLVTAEGAPVEMPTDFDDFSPLADRDYSDVPEQAAAHARLLEDTMTAAGFRPYQGEWSHFTDTDDYPVAETPEMKEEELYADYGH